MGKDSIDLWRVKWEWWTNKLTRFNVTCNDAYNVTCSLLLIILQNSHHHHLLERFPVKVEIRYAARGHIPVVCILTLPLIDLPKFRWQQNWSQSIEIWRIILVKPPRWSILKVLTKRYPFYFMINWTRTLVHASFAKRFTHWNTWWNTRRR